MSAGAYLYVVVDYLRSKKNFRPYVGLRYTGLTMVISLDPEKFFS
jgi:hypothetical protein